jgi:hypothetical protein
MWPSRGTRASLLSSRAGVVYVRAETPASVERSSQRVRRASWRSLLCVVHVSSERTLEPVHQDSSFAEKQKSCLRSCPSSNSTVGVSWSRASTVPRRAAPRSGKRARHRAARAHCRWSSRASVRSACRRRPLSRQGDVSVKARGTLGMDDLRASRATMRLAVASVGDCESLDGGARDARWSPNAVVSPVACGGPLVLRRVVALTGSGASRSALRPASLTRVGAWAPMGASAARPANG